jgi:hypothetical protein
MTSHNVTLTYRCDHQENDTLDNHKVKEEAGLSDL